MVHHKAAHRAFSKVYIQELNKWNLLPWDLPAGTDYSAFANIAHSAPETLGNGFVRKGSTKSCLLCSH